MARNWCIYSHHNPLNQLRRMVDFLRRSFHYLFLLFPVDPWRTPCQRRQSPWLTHRVQRDQFHRKYEHCIARILAHRHSSHRKINELVQKRPNYYYYYSCGKLQMVTDIMSVTICNSHKSYVSLHYPIQMESHLIWQSLSDVNSDLLNKFEGLVQNRPNHFIYQRSWVSFALINQIMIFYSFCTVSTLEGWLSISFQLILQN